MKSTFARWISTIAIVVVLLSQLSIVPAQPVQAAAWTPASLGSTLGLWLDASDAASITSSSGLVSQWNDKSGNSRHATQPTSGSQPTYTGTALSFGSSSKFMSGVMAANSFPTSMQVTVVSTSIGSNTYWAYPFNRTKNNYPAPFDLYNTTVYIGTGDNIAGYGDYGVNFGTLTTRSMVSTTLSASKIEQFLNGTNRLSRPGSYPYGDGSVGLYQIATRADRVTQFTGEINEVIVTNELSNSDRVSLEAYLGAKWSLSGVPTPPATSSAPTVTGIARTGETLTTSNGTWTGTPTSYSYQWQRSATSGGVYTNISSATSNTYEVSDTDVGYFIKASVSATNGIGTSSAALSSATVAVVDIAPQNTAIPVVTGTARTGETLTASKGSWSSAPASSTTFAYQWKRANAVGGTYNNITSATDRTYELTDADIDKFIKVSVIATNSIGASLASLSGATSVVVDLNDSVVPTTSTPVATATGFSFSILNYLSSYTYALTTTKGTVSRLTDDVTVTGLTSGESATVTIAVTRSLYKPATKAVTGSAAAALTIVIQAPVTTVAQGQVSVATLAPTTTTLPVLGANGLLVPTTTTSTIAPTPSKTVTTTTLPRIVTTTTLGPPVVEKVSAGQTAVQVDGVKTDATVTRENNQMVVNAGSLSATMSGLDETGKTAPLDSDGNIHLEGGDVIKISVGGFKPGTLVEVWLFSTPTKLGSVVVGTDGTVTGAYRLPVGIKSGSHRVVVTARMANGKPTTFTLGILVGDISKTSTLTRVLIAIPISLAIGFGFLLPTQLRHRRRKKFSHA
jgi:hypothetical protein